MSMGRVLVSGILIEFGVLLGVRGRMLYSLNSLVPHFPPTNNSTSYQNSYGMPSNQQN